MIASISTLSEKSVFEKKENIANSKIKPAFKQMKQAVSSYTQVYQSPFFRVLGLKGVLKTNSDNREMVCVQLYHHGIKPN